MQQARKSTMRDQEDNVGISATNLALAISLGMKNSFDRISSGKLALFENVFHELWFCVIYRPGHLPKRIYIPLPVRTRAGQEESHELFISNQASTQKLKGLLNIENEFFFTLSLFNFEETCRFFVNCINARK
jgi:hypothetical protein